MKRKILLPTDFSKNSWSAILYAINLYKNEACTFYLLHSWSFVNAGARTYITNSYIDGLRSNSENELLLVKEMALAESANSKHEFKTLFSTSNFLDFIKLSVEEHQIDMIIMGTKGSSGLNQILFGSNTVKLMNNIKSCPVLAVPNKFEFVIPKTVLFPTGYYRLYGDELAYLTEFCDIHKSEIKVLYINQKEKLSEKQQQNFTMLKNYLQNCFNSFHEVEKVGDKQAVINNFIGEFNINILAMINYEHSFIENIMKEPVINKLGFELTVPFLVIPDID